MEPTTPPRKLAVLALALLGGAGCSGGGGGGPSLAAPVIVSAAFVGAGVAPVAGDTLIFFMSRDVSLTGALLDDSDVTLSAGTLGAVAGAPSLLNARAVQITLGAGVSFAPGTTTITFSTDNDAVEGATDGQAAAGGSVAITMGDAEDPVATLTLNGIDAVLNGNGPAMGTLQVPRNGFTIDVGHTDVSSAINTAATSLTANVNIGGVTAGNNLISLFTAASTPTLTTYTVPGSVNFPDGNVTLTVVVADATGRSSAPINFAFRVTALSDGIRPFETSTNASQVWYLDMSKDLESFTYVGGPTPVTVNPGANGRADIQDLYFIVGMFGSDPIVNATVKGLTDAVMLLRLATLFDGVNVTFTLTSPGSFPGGGNSVPYNSHGFSQICIAGASAPESILGLALFDKNNATQNDNCATFMGSRLGVFMYQLVNLGMLPSSVTFRATYDPFAPGLGGVPIGDDGDDANRIAGNPPQDLRATQINNAIARMAFAIALVTAHECGHSMGLVPDGAMPTGLYGGMPSFFPMSTSTHIANGALFGGGAQNVMSPGITFTGMITAGSAFNTLNLAYLRERALYDN